MNKPKIIAAVVVITALLGYVGYNYAAKQSRAKARRAAAAAKQAAAKPPAQADVVANPAPPPAQTADAQPDAAQVSISITPGDGAYSPSAGEAAAENQNGPVFESQKVAAQTADGATGGGVSVRTEELLSGAKTLSVPFASLNDPTLSPADRKTVDDARRARLKAEADRIAAAAEAERKKREAEEARLKELELQQVDPTRAIRNRIRLNGVIGQEVFIGDNVYTVGSTVYGAKIVSVYDGSVVFSYKGQKFTKKVEVK